MIIPKVSVIVPIYNVEPYLERCVDSIRNQTLKDLEIILVDDGSPDNCPAMCDDFAKKDARIKVIHKKNAGLGEARNSGLDLATGEYIAFVDSDDFIESTMYEDLYDLAQKEDADHVRSNTLYDNAGVITEKKDVEQETVFRGKKEVGQFLLDYVAPLPEYKRDAKYTMSVWRGIYRHSVIKENSLKFISERIIVSEDKPFNMEFFALSDCIVYSHRSYYHYCFNGSSLTSFTSREKCEKKSVLINWVRHFLNIHFSEDEYLLHYQRFLLFELRIAIASERKICRQNGESWSAAIKHWSNKPEFRDVLRTYPFHRMPVKVCMFYLALKYQFMLPLSILYK